MLTRSLRGRDFITLRDFSKHEVVTILETALALKTDYGIGKPHKVLDGRTLFMIFFNPSMRTRNSFEAGMFQLGGHAHFLEPGATRIPSLEGEDIAYKTERISDVARTLNGMGDCISIRILGDVVGWEHDKGLRIIREFAKWADIPVINMEDNIYHPCQGIADVMTMWELFGRDLRGLKIGVAWTFSGSTKKPIAPHHDVMYASSYFGPNIVYARPPEMRIDPDVEAAIKANVEANGGTYTVSDRFEDAFADADIVYAKNHVCLDLLPPVQPKPKHEEMEKLFAKYKHWIADAKHMKMGKDHVKYMHCLPCERAQEVADEVMDSPKWAAVWTEAENRLHGQKAVMALIMQPTGLR
jgi:N-acetylornithine carbamoyltransferase